MQSLDSKGVQGFREYQFAFAVATISVNPAMLPGGALHHEAGISTQLFLLNSANFQLVWVGLFAFLPDLFWPRLTPRSRAGAICSGG